MTPALCRAWVWDHREHAGDQAQVDGLTAAAAENGWSLMFADKHPHAGGPQTYAAYLSNADGYEVELIASNP